MSEPPTNPQASRIQRPIGPSQEYVTHGKNVRVESVEELKRLPPGAVRLSRDEVMMGLPVAISSVYMVSVVRHKFKLGRYHARGIQYVSASVFPTMFCPILSMPYILEPAMIKEYPCAECLATRMGLANVAGGILWAGALASVGALYYAKRFYTVPLPPISPRYAKDYGKILLQPYLPNMPGIFGYTVFVFAWGYIGGIKAWYYGQELNFTEMYIAEKSQTYYGDERPYPEFKPTAVQADWITEMIANFSLRNLTGRAIAAEKDDEDEEYVSPWVKGFKYLRNPMLIYDYFFGSD